MVCRIQGHYTAKTNVVDLNRLGAYPDATRDKKTSGRSNVARTKSDSRDIQASTSKFPGAIDLFLPKSQAFELRTSLCVRRARKRQLN